MIIKFKLRDYDDILDEYCDLFEEIEPINSEEKNGTMLAFSGPRIVFPSLHISIREAYWYERNEQVADPKDEDAWEEEDSVYVLYDENEININNYIGFMTGYIEFSIRELCKDRHIKVKNPAALDCYIDTSEFIDEKYVQELFPDNCQD